MIADITITHHDLFVMVMAFWGSVATICLATVVIIVTIRNTHR